MACRRTQGKPVGPLWSRGVQIFVERLVLVPEDRKVQLRAHDKQEGLPVAGPGRRAPSQPVLHPIPVRKRADVEKPVAVGLPVDIPGALHLSSLHRAVLVQDLILDPGSLAPLDGPGAELKIDVLPRTHEKRKARGVRCEMPDDHDRTRSQSERSDLHVCPALSVSVLFCCLPHFHGDEWQHPNANCQNPMFRIEGGDLEDALNRRPGHNDGLQQRG